MFKREMYSEGLFLVDVESGSIPRKKNNLGCLPNMRGEPNSIMLVELYTWTR
jgi:hypothetical protein